MNSWTTGEGGVGKEKGMEHEQGVEEMEEQDK